MSRRFADRRGRLFFSPARERPLVEGVESQGHDIPSEPLCVGGPRSAPPPSEEDNGGEGGHTRGRGGVKVIAEERGPLGGSGERRSGERASFRRRCRRGGARSDAIDGDAERSNKRRSSRRALALEGARRGLRERGLQRRRLQVAQDGACRRGRRCGQVAGGRSHSSAQRAPRQGGGLHGRGGGGRRASCDPDAGRHRDARRHGARNRARHSEVCAGGLRAYLPRHEQGH